MFQQDKMLHEAKVGNHWPGYNLTIERLSKSISFKFSESHL